MFLTQIIDPNKREREGNGGGEGELKKQCQRINCEGKGVAKSQSWFV